VLEGAAVAGDPFEPELAAAAADVSEREAIDALDVLLQRDLVRPTGVPRRFAFRHPLVRAAVYEAIRPGRRIGSHERIGLALSARGASADSLAHHVDQSARHGDTDAVAILREAAGALSYRSPDGAARWLEAALRLLPETAPPEERIELLTSLAKARAATGRLDDAREALVSGIELLGAPEDARAVSMAVTCAGVEQLLGRHDDARRRLRRALQALGEANDPGAAALMIQLALDASYRPSSEGWRPWITRALALIEPLDDGPLTAFGFSVAALLCAYATEVEAADEYRSRAVVVVVDRMADEEQSTSLEALVHLVGAEVYLEHFESAIVHGQRALRLSRATGQGGLLPLLAPAFSLALWTRGRLADAADVLDGAMESSRLVRDKQALAWHLLNRGFNAASAGDVDLALRACRESFELGQELDGSFIAMWASICLAAAHLEDDDPVRALELFETSGAGEVLELIPGFWRAMWLDILARCQVAAGDVVGARRSAGAAAAVASSTPMLRMAGAWAARADARAARAEGDAGSAAVFALGSAEVFEQVGAPIEEGLARALAGAALAEAGDRGQAIAELARAAGAFDGCGAIRYRQAAERELRRLGEHVQRTPRGRGAGDGLASLTDREMEIARLVVERKTNPEIAGELFLSQKTVETHLRNVFRKLDVSSRVEVARAVERADADAAN